MNPISTFETEYHKLQACGPATGQGAPASAGAHFQHSENPNSKIRPSTTSGRGESLEPRNPKRFPPVSIANCNVGRGLFAAERIVAGRDVLQFSGPLLTLNEVRSCGQAAANALQIGVDRYLYLDEPGRLVNHSCQPNAAILDDIRLVALRNIAPGEEIRFDYSTTISDGWTMSCQCGSTDCRGLVVAFQLLPGELRKRYAVLGCVQRFIREDVGA